MLCRDAGSDLLKGRKRRHGYSRNRRPDCPQVAIAPVAAPEGSPLAYEVLPGNIAGTLEPSGEACGGAS